MSKNIEPTPCVVCGGEAGEGRTWCEPCVDKWMGDTILLQPKHVAFILLDKLKQKGLEHE